MSEHDSIAYAQSGSPNNGHADCLFFERSTDGYSKQTLDKSTAAKLKLQHYYRAIVEQAQERKKRYCKGRFEIDLGMRIVELKFARKKKSIKNDYYCKRKELLLIAMS